MANINVVGCGHGNKSEADAEGVLRYNAYPPGDRLSKVQRAVAIVNNLDKSMSLTSACNRYFAGLPRGRTFRHFWRSKLIYINYDPGAGNETYGATHSNGKDITLTRWCIDRHNFWEVGATIIHEFAHIGGASGDAASTDAEGAVNSCRFGPQYDPSIHGQIQSIVPLLKKYS